MPFLLGPLRKHIPGLKELTDHNEILTIEAPKEVLIPLMAMNSQDLEVYVNEGDRVLMNQKVAARNDHFVIPLFSPVSGTVTGFRDEFHSWGGRKVKHIVIENDSQYESVSPTPLDYTQASKDEIVEHIKEMGIVGCGGAGFPTYLKYQPMKETPYLIINAVECEPYLTQDYRNVVNYLDEMVNGIHILRKAGNVQKTFVAIKEDKTEQIARMKEAFSSYDDIEVKAVPNVYPMGWERTLVYEVLGKRYDRLPNEVGAVVNNSTTCIWVSRAFNQGVPITEKLVTVSGDGVKEPHNVLAKIGTPIGSIVDLCGGPTDENIHVIHGGPMMGKTMLSPNVVINNTSNSLTVLVERKIDPIGCLRCAQCVDHCPAGIMPVKIQDAEKAKNLDLIEKLDADACIECGMCTYICPSKIDVTENVRRAKTALRLRKG